jgi:transcriptional regulator with XRE-family HTH domain
MDDLRIGSVVRTIRIRRRLRQEDLASDAGVARTAVSTVERGHADAMRLATTRRICAALDIRLDLVPRWRGGDLDRLLNSRHAAMAEMMAASFTRMPDWILQPEVTFSVYGERGVIDFVAWHPVRRAMLLIELKTELVDIGDLMATADRRRRLARQIARDQRWQPDVVGIWVAVLETTTNARRIREHGSVLRAAFPAGGRTMNRWLREPVGPIASLSLRSLPELPHARPGNVRRVARPRQRVVRPDQPLQRATEASIEGG